VLFVEMVERLNLARLGSDQVGRRAGLLDRFARRGQLDLLDALLRDQERDRPSIQAGSPVDPP
jgi:hypothetical protein